MPANRTVASLTIALIVFVMLTFVLAITTYLFFTQRIDEQQKAEAAAAETSKARTELNAAIDEKRKLLEILGAPDEKTVAEIEAESNARFTGEFAGFDAEPKTYLALVDWLAKSIREKDTKLDAQRLDHEKKVAEKEAEIRKAQADKGLAEDALKTADADRSAEKQKFDAARQSHEQQQVKLTDEQQKALEESKKFDRLKDKVAEGGRYLSPDEQKTFQAQAANAEGQLGVLYGVLRERTRQIRRQNELLATLRVADSAVQAAVDAATPQDDRIDGFDGHVIAVDQSERTAIVSCRTTRGLRPGLMLSVYDPADPKPRFGTRKGVLEVIEVESPTVARVRIRRDSVRDPIVGGDGVATSLWAPGESPEVVIIGHVQLDGDADTDTDVLQGIVQRAGGRVVGAVTPTTTLVVDAGVPRAVAGDTKVAGWDEVDAKRRDRESKNAQHFGIRIVALDEMLELLGLERAELETGRLPTRGDDGRSLPRRSAGVAY